MARGNRISVIKRCCVIKGDQMKVEFTSHKKKVEQELDEAMQRAYKTIGMMAESQAKRNLTNNKSVDTGLLRNSVTFAEGGKSANISGYKADRGDGSGSYYGTAPTDGKDDYSVYIGTNVEYAAYVELGTSRSAPKPYLLPAANTVGSKMRSIIQSELQKA